MKLFLIFILSSVFVYANAIIGKVEQLKGNVKVKSEGSIKKSKVKLGFEIKEGDLLTTSKGASAVLKLADKSTLVLDASSSIHFKSSVDAEQQGGKVYYNITSRDAQNSLKIKTPFAIIGIKGTTFVVNATEKGSVTLKEGLIGVASIKEEFNLYRKAIMEEFNNFKATQMAEYEKYKNAQSGYAEPVKTKSFDLQSGNRISFNDNQVHEDAWNENDDAEFAHFEALLNSDGKTQENNDTNETPSSEQKIEEDITKVEKSSQKSEQKEIKEEPKAPEVVDDTWNEEDDAEFDAIEASALKAKKLP